LGVLLDGASEAQNEPTKTVVVLVDYSGSVKKARTDYMAALKKVFSRLKVGDHILIWKITEKSEMETKPIVNEGFPIPVAPNEFYLKQATQKAKKEMKEKLITIESMMEESLASPDPLSKKTTILSSLHAAERALKSYKKDKAVLVILSDMIEESSEYNFMKDTLTDKRISDIIGKERAGKRLPELPGATVYVAGAQASTIKRYAEIQGFWLGYFKECGANLPKENYGPVLLKFEE
jgi:hypothetical protein